MNGRGVATAAILLGLAMPAGAQIATPTPGPSARSPGFLPRFAFELGALKIGGGDQDLHWDADFAGDVDLVEFRNGRVTFVGRYEAIVGAGRRAFDPVQGNYTLDVAASARAAGGELAGVFHHVSRHLSDREKREPIDWNMIGGRYTRPIGRGPVEGRATVRALWVLRRSVVDYVAELGADVDGGYRIDRRLAAIGAAALDLFPTRDSDRGAQVGVRLEGGVRVRGAAAAVDLLMAYERRVDADPLRPGAQHLVLVGFRLVHP